MPNSKFDLTGQLNISIISFTGSKNIMWIFKTCWTLNFYIGSLSQTADQQALFLFQRKKNAEGFYLKWCISMVFYLVCLVISVLISCLDVMFCATESNTELKRHYFVNNIPSCLPLWGKLSCFTPCLHQTSTTRQVASKANITHYDQWHYSSCQQ